MVKSINEVDRRRVWRIKGGSYIVSLPKEWAEEIKEKEVIVIKELDNSLRLIPIKVVENKREVKIDFDKFKDPSLIEYSILTYYMQGANRITLFSRKSIDVTLKKRLRELRVEMIGSDIVEDKSDLISYEILIDVSSYSINESIEKINKFINDIHKDTVKAIEKLNKQLSREILDRAKDGIKKYRFIIRQIAIASQNPIIARKIGIEDSRKAIVYGTIASYLNRILAHTAGGNNYVLKMNKEDEVAKDYVLKMAENSYNMRNEAIDALINKDLEKGVKVIKLMSLQKDLEDELLSYLLTGKISIQEAIAYSMIGREFRRVSGYSVGISDALANLILAPVY